MITDAEILQDKLEQVDRDIAEVDEQVAAGELDGPTAEELRATYRRERRRVLDEIDALVASPAATTQSRDRRRVFAGAVLLLAGFAVVSVLLVNAVQQRAPGDLATGGIATDVATGDVDLATVTNEEMEAVVADNPQVVGMRLALARRYFDAGEFDKALDHYLVVLEQEPDQPEALASIGWMTYLSDRPDVAESYVERALATAPDYIQGYWFLGNIRLVGLGDSAGAIDPLERLLDFGDIVPDDIRVAAEALLEEARADS